MSNRSKQRWRKPGQPFFNVGCVIGTALPLLFVLIGVIWGGASFANYAGTEAVDGVVVGFEDQFSTSSSSNDSRGGFSYRPIVEYVVAGKHYRCTTSAFSGSKVWVVGERMQVRYKSDHPESGMIDSFFQRWLGPLVFTSGGVVFLFFIYVGSFASSATPSKNQRIWWWRFAAGQACCLVFLVPGLVVFISAYRHGLDVDETTGTVVSVRQVTRDTVYYKPIVWYEVEGKRYECDDLEWSSGERPKTGSKMTIRYRADNPRGVIGDSTSQLWLGAICLLIGGAIPEVATIVYLIRHKDRAAKKARSHEQQQVGGPG